MAEDKRADKVTEMMLKLPRVMEDSVARGFDRIIALLKGESVKTETASKSHYAREEAEDKIERSAKARDRATEIRIAVDAALKLNRGYSKGLQGIQEKVYIHLSNAEKRTKGFFEKMTELSQRIKDYFKSAKEEFLTMGFNTFRGIVKTFTGPFYGLLSKTAGVMTGAALKMGSKVIGNIGFSSLNKLLGKYSGAHSEFKEKPKEITYEEKILAALGSISADIKALGTSFSLTGISALLTTALSNQKLYADKIVDAIHFAAEYITDSVDKLSIKPAAFEKTGELGGKVAGMAKGGTVSTAGIAMLHPAEVVTPSGIFDKQFDYYDFFKEQALNINDYLKKILGVEKEQKAGGLLDNLPGGGTAGGGWMAKAKQFAFGKWGSAAAGGAGLLSGGIEAYKTLKPSQEKYGTGLGTANAVARGMISGSLSFIGARLFGATGAAIGGIVGDKIGSISNTIGEKLGTGLFDAKELVGAKMSAAGDKLSAMGDSIASSFSGAKDYAVETFTKVGAGFKSGVDIFKKSITSYFPSGESISDTLKSILSGIISVGPAVVKVVQQAGDTAKKAGDATRDAVKRGAQTAKDVGSRGVESVKRAFNIGGSRWKAETKGVNPEVMKAFNAAALDYKAQTGKTATLTEGVRTREQQALLGKGNKYMTAKPGMSIHEQGFALDVNSADAREMERLGILAKHGLTRPYGEKDPVHIELAKYASAQERAKIRAGKIPSAAVASAPSPKPKVQAAAMGAFTKTGGLAELHPAEIVSPIGKFTEMLSRTAMGIAAPVMSGMGDESTKYLAQIATGINKLVETGEKTPATAREVKATPIPDFPGDPGTIYGGNYFPQKGRQWG